MDLYGFKDNKRGRGKNDQKSNTCYTIPKKKKKGRKKVIRPTISSQRDLKRDRQVLITESRSNSRLLLRDN